MGLSVLPIVFVAMVVADGVELMGCCNIITNYLNIGTNYVNIIMSKYVCCAWFQWLKFVRNMITNH